MYVIPPDIPPEMTIPAYRVSRARTSQGGSASWRRHLPRRIWARIAQRHSANEILSVSTRT